MTKPTQQKKSLTKEEVIAEIKQCAKKLERVPTYSELRRPFGAGANLNSAHARWALAQCSR